MHLSQATLIGLIVSLDREERKQVFQVKVSDACFRNVSISHYADGLEQSKEEGSLRVEEEATLALGMALEK